MRILFVLFMGFALLYSQASFAQDSFFGESKVQEDWKDEAKREQMLGDALSDACKYHGRPKIKYF